MASSSSAKKVARVAAKSGSVAPGADSPGAKRNWLFAGAIVLIVALGVGVVLMARDENVGLGDNTEPPKANLQDGEPFDHWHAAFAIEVCGTELPALQDGATDPLGIHTHGDGLIHIHPFTRSAAGERARLGKYFGQVSLTVTDTGFRLPDGMTMEDGGTTVQEGETTCGGKEGELVLAHWEDAANSAGAEPDQIIRSGFGDVRFTEDLGAYTLAFIPKGSTTINPPSSAADIVSLGAADGGVTPEDSGTAGDIPAETPATEGSTEDTTATTAASTEG